MKMSSLHSSIQKFCPILQIQIDSCDTILGCMPYLLKPSLSFATVLAMYTYSTETLRVGAKESRENFKKFHEKCLQEINSR